METVIKQKVTFSIDVEISLGIDLELVKKNYNIHNNRIESAEEFDDVHYKLGTDLTEAINKFTEEVVIDFKIDEASGFKITRKEIDDVYNVNIKL